MSLAENLLNSLPDDAAVSADSFDEEPHIKVNADRSITIPAQLRTIAVTGDKNVETVTFDCVRYWDEHDLSYFAIFLNFTLPDGTQGTYTPLNISRYSDHYSFDWTIGSGLTRNKGSLQISLVAKETNNEGLLTKQWGSFANDELVIVKALPGSDNIIDEEDETDLAAQILAAVNGKADVADVEEVSADVELNTAQIEKAKEQSDAILEAFDTTGGHNLLDPANTEKGYYKGAVGGGFTVVGSGGIQVRTTNFISIPSGATKIYLKTNIDPSQFDEFDRTAYIGFADKNGVCLEATNRLFDDLFSFPIPEGATQFHFWTTGGIPAISFTADMFCVATTNDSFEEYGAKKTPTKLKESYLPEIKIEHPIVQETGTSKTQAMSQNAASTAFANSIKKTVSGDIVRVYDVSPVKHQIKVKVTCPEGIDPAAVTIRAGGKNLIPFPYPLLSGMKTQSGLTATVQDDGGICFNGTSTKTTYWNLCYAKFGRDITYYRQQATKFLASGNACVEGWKTRAQASNGLCMVEVNAGTYENLVVYPVIEYGAQVTEYEKGAEHSIGTPNAEGIVMLNSVGPTMTVWADTEGVSLEVEYNGDLEKVKEKAEHPTIKKMASGGDIITIDDASTKTHDIKVKLKGVDATNVEVTKLSGKNLLDLDSGIGETSPLVKNADGSYTFMKKGNYRTSNLIPIYLKAGKPYRFTVETVQSTITKNLILYFCRADGTNITSAATGMYPTLSETAYWVKLALDGLELDGAYITFRAQIEEGEEYTGCEQYKGETYKVSADGSVIGLTSSPYMQLRASYYSNTPVVEGATLDVEYEVDVASEIDKTKTELENAKSSFPYADYTNIPTFYFNGDITAMTKDVKVTLDYIYGDKSGICTMKWQGSSSLNYAKKNYTVVFDKAFEAVEGWGEQTKYCLKADWIDASHLRNVTTAKLWGDIVRKRKTSDLVTRLSALSNCGAIDGFPCFVVINGEWKGIYNFNIPKDGWMFGMNDDTAKHAILCAGNSSTATRFLAEATLDTHFDLEYNSEAFATADIQSSLNALINACINSDGSDIDTTISQYLDINSAIDYMIFTAAIRGIDILEKNYILATYDGTKWFFSAYDLDCVLGLHWNGSIFLNAGYLADGQAYMSFSHIASRHRLFKLLYDNKKADIVKRYKELRKTVLSPSWVTYQYYNYGRNIPRTAFDAELELWKTIPSNNGNDAHHIATWYAERIKWVDDEIAEMEASL